MCKAAFSAGNNNAALFYQIQRLRSILEGMRADARRKKAMAARAKGGRQLAGVKLYILKLLLDMYCPVD